MFGGVESGGTKFVCMIATDAANVVDEVAFPTRDPDETVQRAIDYFRTYIAGGGRLASIGIASFGPLELREDDPRYGHIVTTPKAGWSDTDMVGPFREAFGVPVGFDTDVNGAALAEGAWGAAQGLDSFVYITIGTGIGGGAVVGGLPVHGLVHPEMGHLALPRVPGDTFAGVCPFHTDCFEGMASGPAIAARWGKRGEEMTPDELERATALEASYIALGVRNIAYTLAPQRVIIGGGVAGLPGLFPAINRSLRLTLAQYPGVAEHTSGDFVVPAGLGHRAGPLGAIALAARAAHRVS